MFKTIIDWFTATRRLKSAQAKIAHLESQVKTLSEGLNNINNKNYTGAVYKEVYRKNVLDKIGNAYLSPTDDPAFKLGVQFALRFVENAIVQD